MSILSDPSVFLGHIVDDCRIRPARQDPGDTKHSSPTNVREVCRFFETVNQFAPKLAEVTKSLWDLLIKGNPWIWEAPQQKSFIQIKQMLTTSPILAFFDPGLKTVVSVDTSSYDLGATLLQQQPGEELKPWSWICILVHDTNGTKVCPNRKRSPSAYLCQRMIF